MSDLKKILRPLRLATAFSSLLLATIGYAQAADRNVCAAGGTYTTIAAAIAAASAGDTIRICPGAYHGAVTVNKANLIFRSTTGNRADVTLTHSGTTFSVEGANTRIRDMTIVSTGGRAILTAWAGSGSHVFENLVVSSHDDAIEIANGGLQTFRNLVVSSATGNGIDTLYNAIGAHVFENVQVTANREGIKLANGGPFLFSNVKVTSTNAKGIELSSNVSGNHAFSNVEVASQTAGIEVGNGGTLSFKNVKVKSAEGVGISTAYAADGAHTFEDIEVTARREGIYALRGAALIRNAEIVSQESDGIKIGNKYAGVFQNIKVNAWASGFYITNQDSGQLPAHLMAKLDIKSVNSIGLNVALSGKLTITDLNVVAKGNGVHLAFDANGPHEIRKVAIVSSAGKGLVADRGMGVLENASIEAQDMALDVSNQYDISITGLSVKSSNATAINFNNNSGVGSRYSLKNVTVENAGGAYSDGLYFHTATNTPQVLIDNICVRSAGRHGINFHWNATNVAVKNSIFRGQGQGQYAVYLGANPAHNAHINNSCFYDAPCAYSTSTNHDFSGNFWGGGVAACTNSPNVNASAPLGSCPIPENVCYTSTIGVPPPPGGMNAFETTTPAGAITGVIKTKIAGSAFNLDVVALNDAKNAVATGFSGEVKVELLGSTVIGAPLDANNCPQTASPLFEMPITLAFAAADAGRKTVNLPAIPNAWRDVRVRLSYPATGTPSIVTCSTDNFAIRPYALTSVQARDANWETAGLTRTLGNMGASGGVVHKAGRPFTLSVNAVNAGSTVTWNYAGSPTVKTIACTLPTPTCVNGTLTIGAWTGSGMRSAQAAQYSEAGSFNLTLEDATFASVDNKQGDSSPAEYTIPQLSPVPVGRFVPNHFTLSAASPAPSFRTFDASCSAARSFTYIGQPFRFAQAPAAAVTARNAANAPVLNYSLNLWKLASSGVVQQYTSDRPRDPDQIHPPGITASPGNTGTGFITINSADTLTFKRDAAVPQAEFNASISLSLSVSDTTETATGQGAIQTLAPLVFNGSGSGIAFDSGSLFRYGRLRLASVYGPREANLQVPVRAQFWNGSTFVANTNDNCTAIDSAHVHIVDYIGGISASTLPQAHVSVDGPLQGGSGKIVVDKPVAMTSKGAANLCINLGPDSAGATCATPTEGVLPWLKDALTQPNYVEDPRARASFGIYRSSPVIYMREIY